MAINNRRKFMCLDCGVDTSKINELYMLIDETWALTGVGKFGMLCVTHAEQRIKRQLVGSDFNSSYLNNFRTNAKSAKLVARMQS